MKLRSVKATDKSVLAITAGYMDGSVRADAYSTISEVEEFMERYKAICQLVCIIPIYEVVWLPSAEVSK